ncbi:penicillin-binding protein activator LpoB [Ectothiorhodospira variabilis]|uniref:penicillin-binding protein activator LpoB n=1 Tax=Ectothiorhodospira variabilis TaxID=505694 RepID=UPI001EFA3E2C|nr:penicillin-binding protein activator LpoB [Ectothiorhodospira variabilis]MCG5495842.1 penicillin-binding protein activator LpoB [Ectothiorhodospira variabilis]MCG5498952.1 penicillin-binding protein activator LpoB [Ectothiorhodospira variabilis]MCG5504543.1 penicillin-binding protein activator LpoB [Ectothiorhodospira variabilis]MCG5507750.1 penicillin-binding protein activator LpoB [Ectothiorhodospira variabilis]
MTDRMMRDMLSNPSVAGQVPPARVIVDADYLRNESSSRINRNIITDRLRVELNRAANGRIVFVGRHYSDMVAEERRLKRENEVSHGSGQSALPSGADYRLGGRITSIDAVDASQGKVSRYHQFIFEMVDLETSNIVWTGMYDYRRSAQDDIIYR